MSLRQARPIRSEVSLPCSLLKESKTTVSQAGHFHRAALASFFVTVLLVRPGKDLLRHEYQSLLGQECLLLHLLRQRLTAAQYREPERRY